MVRAKEAALGIVCNRGSGRHRLVQTVNPVSVQPTMGRNNKNIVLCLSLLFTACIHTGNGTDMKETMLSQTDEGLVYYFGFEIERITGIPEHQMEDHGCLYKISREDFEKSLLTDKESIKNLHYEKLDIRAKIIFSDRHYFVSRAGVVNTGKGYVLLDKKKFVDHLVSLKKCMTK